MITLKSILPIVSILFLYNCGTESNSIESNIGQFAITTKNESNNFDKYWYQGKAEISSYDLKQARYGEIHQGSAVLVFVTEDFSKKKQVKLDNPSANPKDAIPILKLNMTRKFNTGVYPYSIMQSTFTPVDLKEHPNTLKVTSSSQEWCGHTFMQLNLENNSYNTQVRSYFESEGDKDSNLKKSVLEDELWSIIRIDPKQLPIGEFDIIPSTTYARLRHITFRNERATASLKENEKEIQYDLDYKNIDRKLSIVFEKAFPHQIISWEESFKSGFGSTAKTLVTKASRKKSMLLDYWSKNGNADLHYREELGLED